VHLNVEKNLGYIKFELFFIKYMVALHLICLYTPLMYRIATSSNFLVISDPGKVNDVAI